MRRTLVLAGLGAAAALAGVLILLRPTPVEANKNQDPAAAKPSRQGGARA